MWPCAYKKGVTRGKTQTHRKTGQRGVSAGPRMQGLTTTGRWESLQRNHPH